ncbi:hypothetical protein C812_03721 [Paenibacillus barengoltzii G22]|uniref:Uncharacterized protein n=1 Tax=Paenibacillus barengoltzii G22 TaxID=1235795 RepID=R9L5Y1_9BACL|nr:hypothetical protein C812_03721 [Paenibacillus barengoltzii G22]
MLEYYERYGLCSYISLFKDAEEKEECTDADAMVNDHCKAVTSSLLLS